MKERNGLKNNFLYHFEDNFLENTPDCFSNRILKEKGAGAEEEEGEMQREDGGDGEDGEMKEFVAENLVVVINLSNSGRGNLRLLSLLVCWLLLVRPSFQRIKLFPPLYQMSSKNNWRLKNSGTSPS